MVVLAAAAAERIHRKERSAVLDPRAVVFGIADHFVGAGDVPERLEVRHHRSRIAVESHLLAVLGPERVSAKAQQDLVRIHLLHDPAGLDALPWIDIALTSILVRPEHSAGNLSERPSDQIVRIVRSLQHGRIPRNAIILRRFAETLRDVHVVPVGQGGRIGPVGRVAVDLLRQLKQEFVPRPVVEPQDAQQIVPRAAVLPIGFQKVFLRHGHLPLEIVGHQLNDPLISRVFIIGLQAPEHYHLRPDLDPAAGAVLRAEKAVGPRAAESPLDPDLGLGYHVLVHEDIGEVTIAFEPVGHLLPAVVAAFAEPCVPVLLKPFADFPKMAGQPVTLTEQIFARPSVRLDVGNRKFYETLGQKRCAIGDVIGAAAVGRRSVHDGDSVAAA